MDLGASLGKTERRRRWRTVAAIVLGASAVLAWLLCPRPGHPEPRGTIVGVHGFSILADAFYSDLAPAFQREWTARTGETVRFVATFNSLGSVTNDLLAGAPAEVAFLSPELGAGQLIAGGLLPGDALQRLPHHGVFAETPLVLAVRPGNPRGIRDFSDLARPDLAVVHGDPKLSGAGHWALLAAYGGAWRRSGRPQDGYEALLGIWRNVAAQGATAREARSLFQEGTGDALITYEQDALWGIRNGELQAEIVYPHSTIVAEVCVVTIDRHIDPGETAAVRGFVDFLWSPGAQDVLRRHGFRGQSAADPSLPRLEDPFRISDLGGWRFVRSEILEGAWRSVQRELKR